MWILEWFLAGCVVAGVYVTGRLVERHLTIERVRRDLLRPPFEA